jgi:hypothetical protein
LSTAVAPPAGGSSPARAAALKDDAHPQRRARWWVELLTVVWLLWVYDAITNLAPLRLHVAIDHAQGLLSLERTLHIDPEHGLDRWLAGHHTLASAISYYYDNAHFIVTLGLLGFLWWRRADIYRPLRSSLVVVNLLGFLVFWLYPVAPPRMLPGFTDVVASSHTFGSWHTGALASDANQLAAMPSLHIAWAGWCAVVLWQLSERRTVRALAVLYPLLTSFAVLATGNHFVLDIVGGLAVLVIAMLLVRGSERRPPRGTLARRWQQLRQARAPRERAAVPAVGTLPARSRGVERGLQNALQTPAE